MDERTRRGALGGTVAALGLLAGYQSLGGPDDTVVQQYGTPDESLGTLEADQLMAGNSPGDRPLVSNGSRTIYVDPRNGDDGAPGTESEPLATLQAAVRRVPVYLSHQYTIDLATVPETPVTYDEDVLVPAVIGTGTAGQEDNAAAAGPFNNLVIEGDNTDVRSVRVGSIMFANVVGTSVAHIKHVTVTRDSPYDDENHGLSAYGSGELRLYDVAFSDGPTNGILSYGAKVKASVVDFGQDLGIGLHGKRHASIIARELTGALSDAAFRATENTKLTIRRGNNATGNPQYSTRTGGVVYDLESESWIGLDSGSASQRQAHRSPPGEGQSAPGDVWYEDGSGDADEGYYGQTRDGPVKLS